MSRTRVSQHGIWTYKETTSKPFTKEWAQNNLRLVPHILGLIKIAISKRRWWMFKLVLVTAVRQLIEEGQVYLYRAIIETVYDLAFVLTEDSKTYWQSMPPKHKESIHSYVPVRIVFRP